MENASNRAGAVAGEAMMNVRSGFRAAGGSQLHVTGDKSIGCIPAGCACAKTGGLGRRCPG
jgi:hypothetical protein